MNNKMIKMLVIVFSLVFVLITCSKGKNNEDTVLVLKTSGELQVNGKIIKSLSALKKGDIIKTEDSSEAFIDLELSDGHKIRLKGGELVLEEISKDIKLKHNSGKLFVAVTKLRKDNDFVIATPTAIAAVRGTKFMMEEKGEKTYFCVCEGKIAARKSDNSESEVIVSQGEDLYIETGVKTDKPIKSPMMVKMALEEFSDMGVVQK